MLGKRHSNFQCLEGIMLKKKVFASSGLCLQFLMTCLFTAALCLLGCLSGEKSAPSGTGKAIPLRKKIIGFACNTVEPAYLKEHIGEIESVLPMDGLIVFVYPDDWGVKRSGQEDIFFGGRKLKREDFSRAVADLKATGFSKFTDNFIQFATSARGSAVTGKVEHGNLDWFDPNWPVIAENGAVIAWVAKEAGFKGFFLDVEDYSGTLGKWGHLFDYSARSDTRSQADVDAQIRRRGREWMQAVSSVYPDITIVIIINTGWERHNMVQSFVKGMLDARGRATLIDGGEGGYHLIIHEQFAALREGAESRHRTDQLFRPLQYAIGVWVDPTPNKYGGWHTDPVDFEKNYRSPVELEHALHGALTVADRYVWLFTWHPNVWFNPTVRPRPMLGQCVLCPHEKVPDAFLEALRNCRKPHDLNWTPKVREGRFVYFDDAVLVLGRKIDTKAGNLLKNAGLEMWSEEKDKSPDGWIAAGQGVNIRREETSVKSGQHSAKLTSVLPRGHVFLDQHIPAAPYAGKTITLGAWMRTDMKDVAGVEILDFVGDIHEVSVEGSGSHPGDGKWHFATTRKTIRQGATGQIVLRLSAHIPYEKGEK